MQDVQSSSGRRLIAIGAILAALAVAAGAFAAHGLRARLSPDMLAVFETAVRYQMYHALALIGCGIAAPGLQARWLGASAALFIVGTALFSGSLYLLTLSGIRILGAVTPLGGVAWLLGWICLAIAALAPRTEDSSTKDHFG